MGEETNLIVNVSNIEKKYNYLRKRLGKTLSVIFLRFQCKREKKR